MRHTSGLLLTGSALIVSAALISSTVAAASSAVRRVDISEQTSTLRADPLLSVDVNRTEIVARLMTQWQGDIALDQRDSFKQKLAGLRADRLLAVSLVGSFDGVLDALSGQDKNNHALSTLSALNRGDRSKALGEPDKDLVYTPLNPCRLFDTRAGQPSALGQIGGVFTPNSGRNIVPATACGIPATGVKSLFLSFTTLNNTPNSGGFISLLAPLAPVNASNDIFNTGVDWSASNTIVATDTAGQFVVYVATANAHVVVDVLGYFAAPSAGNGLRVVVSTTANSPIILNGSSTNTVGNSSNVQRAVTVSGGFTNRGGSPSGYKGWYSTIGGGAFNKTGADDNSSGDYSTVGGGFTNQASGDYSTVPGGRNNVAVGTGSFAAGSYATATHDGSFVWSDHLSFTPFQTSGVGQFAIRATGGVHLSSQTNLNFGSNIRQNINLYGAQGEYGIGVQSSTLYNRSALNYAWYVGGAHAATAFDSGGGSVLATLQSGAGSATVTGNFRALGFTATSDRAAKSAFAAVDAKAILAKVAAMPISTWVYNAEIGTGVRHIGPVAQDFARAFNVGYDDKSISSIDASGVALTAIKGLHQVAKEKDAKIAAMQRELAAIKAKLGM